MDRQHRLLEFSAELTSSARILGARPHWDLSPLEAHLSVPKARYGPVYLEVGLQERREPEAALLSITPVRPEYRQVRFDSVETLAPLPDLQLHLGPKDTSVKEAGIVGGDVSLW